MLNCEPIMNLTQASEAPAFGDSLAGILIALVVAVGLAGFALALSHWPVEALRSAATTLVLGLAALVAHRWPGR